MNLFKLAKCSVHPDVIFTTISVMTNHFIPKGKCDGDPTVVDGQKHLPNNFKRWMEKRNA